MNWNKELSAAQTEVEIVRLANDYVNELPFMVKRLIPAECRAVSISDSTSMIFWSAQLANRFGDAAIAAGDAQLQDLVLFFISAASKIRALRGISAAANASQVEESVPISDPDPPSQAA